MADRKITFTPRRAQSINWLPLLPLLVLSALSEVLVDLHAVPDYLLPSPSQVGLSLWQDRAEFFQAMGATALASAAGLVLSCAFGMTVAFLLSASRPLRRALYPYAIFFQTVPVIAVAPLLVIWFGFGYPTVIASAFIVSVFPIIASTLLGLQSTDPNLNQLFRLYKTSRWHYWWKLKIPWALPEIFNGVRIGIGLSIIGAIVGEFVGGGGLGALIDVARTQQRVDKVFAAILLSSVIGIAAVFVLDFIQYQALGRWHASAAQEHLE